MEAHEQEVSSIAFPAIGSGDRNIPPDVVVKTMIEEVIDFSDLNPDTQLRDVRLVLDPQDHPTIKVSMDDNVVM